MAIIERTDTRDYDVLAIGAGFSGVGAAIKLKQAGRHDFAVLEKGANVGGTWRDNTYPGCACDVPSALYSFSFAPNPDWSSAYGRQPEIQAYLERVAEPILDHVHFETEVRGAAWDDAEQRWHVETTAGPYRARVLLSAAGPLHEPSIPDLPGIDSFAGTTFHSARWNHDHDLRGRRVAVVGTGSSAIQFVPEIAPATEHLTLFQRTAPWVLPKLDRTIADGEKSLYRSFPPAQRALREALYHFFELVQLAQRHPRAMERIQRIGLRHIERQVKDPELRRLVTPSFTLGCKRILLSNSWYPTLQRDNVSVVPQAVKEIRAHSIVAADGSEHPVDTIVFGTGFHVTDPPTAEHVRGRDGRTLAETWNGSPQAYLGTTVAGFPNLFLTIGPNSGNGHGSAIVLIEAQLKYFLGALQAMDERRAGAVDLRASVQDAYNARVQRALAGTVWNAGGCRSYYLDVNGRNSTIYPWTTIDLRRRTARFDAEHYVLAPALTPVRL